MAKKRKTKALGEVGKYKFVEVIWRDAVSESSWKKLEHIETVTITTRGWLIKEDDEHVTIAASLGHDGDFGEVLTVPKCWTKIRELKVT